jgi:hypothetical protein
MIIRGMKGLGDNIYQRAFVKNLREPIWLETPWPELYQDIHGLHLLRPDTRLRTQAKNISQVPPSIWQRAPRGREIHIHYGRAGIVSGMQRCFGKAPAVFDLPDFGPSPIDGRYAVVRPVTVRKEWIAEARNPLPQYVAEAAMIARDTGLKVVSVADLLPNQEWALDPLPVADIALHHGQLRMRELLALVRGAECVIGGIGWLLPAAIAANVPGWFICGGQGGYNSPELITSSEHMDLHRIEFAVPDNFCRCLEKQHSCDKRISNHAELFAQWLRRSAVLVS